MDKNNAARKRERRRQERKRLLQGSREVQHLRITPYGFDTIYPMTDEIERATAESEAQISAAGRSWSADHAKLFRVCQRICYYDHEAFMRGIASTYLSDVSGLPYERTEEVLADFEEMGMMNRA